MIKKYKEFMKESQVNYKLGCVMIRLDIPNWKEITSMIDIDDVYDPPGNPHGIEENPHVTALWGINPGVDDSMVVDIINKFKYKDLDISVSKIDSFKNKDFDVVKLSVNKSQVLQDFFNELSKLPNSNEFPEYVPHITIAYVLPGKSDKYINPYYKLESFKIKSICYSKPNGQELEFNVY